MSGTTELFIWSAMTGMLLLLSFASLVDWAVNKSVAAARGLSFILLTGSACVLMSGLPQVLLPQLTNAATLPFKASLGPLSGALALAYLGIWMGSARDDQTIRWTVTAGPATLVLCAAGLGVWGLVQPSRQAVILETAAAVNAVSVVAAMVVSVRGVMLGDRLARWMPWACICLSLMVAGLYIKGIGALPFGPLAALATAWATVTYFLITIVLTLWRNRELRQLARLANGLAGHGGHLHAHSSPSLAGGAALIGLVDDALWRSARLQRTCVVAAVSVRNLYDLETAHNAGDKVTAYILAVLAARIRRQVGFRNVVGLYHPRCFVLAVSAVQDPRRGGLVVQKLSRELRRPIDVNTAEWQFRFEADIGFGLVTVENASESAVDAMNRAEQMALAPHSAHPPPRVAP